MKVKIAIISLLVLCLMSGVAYAEKRPIIMVTGGGGSVADATTTTKGKVELATDAEAIAGTSDAVVMTPGNTTAVLAEAQDLTITGGTIKDITALSVAGPATITTHLAVGATPDPDTYSLTVGGPAHYTGTVTTTGNIISGGSLGKVGSGTFLSGYSNNLNVDISVGGQTTMTSFNTNSFVFQARGYDFLDDYTGTAGLMYIQGPVSIGAGIAYTIATAIANYTLTEEVIILLCGTGGADYTVTTNAAADLVGHIFKIKRTGTDKVFFDPNGAETVDGVLDIALDTLNDWIEVTTDGFTWFIIGRNS